MLADIIAATVTIYFGYMVTPHQTESVKDKLKTQDNERIWL